MKLCKSFMITIESQSDVSQNNQTYESISFIKREALVIVW